MKIVKRTSIKRESNEEYRAFIERADDYAYNLENQIRQDRGINTESRESFVFNDPKDGNSVSEAVIEIYEIPQTVFLNSGNVLEYKDKMDFESNIFHTDNLEEIEDLIQEQIDFLNKKLEKIKTLKERQNEL